MDVLRIWQEIKEAADQLVRQNYQCEKTVDGQQLLLSIFSRKDVINGVKHGVMLALLHLKVGVLEVVHHGIEESFFFHEEHGEMKMISMRHRWDEVSPYLCWIRANLACWNTPEIEELEVFLAKH